MTFSEIIKTVFQVQLCLFIWTALSVILSFSAAQKKNFYSANRQVYVYWTLNDTSPFIGRLSMGE